MGIELMMVQGFSPDMKLEFDADDEDLPLHFRKCIQHQLSKKRVTDLDLKKMAGNTMTIPVMMLLQVLRNFQSLPQNTQLYPTFPTLSNIQLMLY